VKLLLVEDHPPDAKLLHRMLCQSSEPQFEIDLTQSLEPALDYLANHKVDLVLLDLSLPDSKGIDTFKALHAKFSSTPVIVLTGLDDKLIAKEAISLGAQDYLLKGEISEALLVKAVLYAIERNQAQLNATHVLTMARDKAIEASTFKSAFVAQISHELRTPLSGVLGMLELLLEADLNKDQCALAERALEAGRSLLTILNDILDLSKIEAGKLSLERVPFNVIYLTQECSRFFATDATKKELKLSTQVDQGIPEFVIGDPTRVRQVLFNFIGNAVKFTDAGSVAVRLDVERQNEDRIHLRFSIADTGSGIARESHELLFKPFSQLGRSSRQKQIGTGLGLAISKRLVEMMEGEIGFQSQEGAGSTFWFVVPFAKTHGPKERVPTDTDKEHLTQVSKGILVVDDSTIIQELVSRQLKQLGYAYKVAPSAEEAIRLVNSNKFDSILMDCGMPGMTGFDATQAIRKQESGTTRRIPIIAMTAMTMTGDDEKCFAAGMDDYLPKPFTLQDLRKKLEKWIPSPQTISSSVPHTLDGQVDT